jgi:hypothetical protein
MAAALAAALFAGNIVASPVMAADVTPAPPAPAAMVAPPAPAASAPAATAAPAAQADARVASGGVQNWRYTEFIAAVEKNQVEKVRFLFEHGSSACYICMDLCKGSEKPCLVVHHTGHLLR